MKRYLKYIISAICVLAILISVCFIPFDAKKLIPIIEKQVTNELGIKIHIDKLILRVGPFLKVKTPVMHIMYEDGQKFGQFNNVKFYIPWSSVLKNDTRVKRLYADNFIVKVNSDDKYLPELLERINEKEFEETPDITLKKYEISYLDKIPEKKYILTGDSLELSKIMAFKTLKLRSQGNFLIDDKKYIGYDLNIAPYIEIPQSGKSSKNFDILYFINQLETLDFHSDIIADLKLYKNTGENTQISGLINIDNISVLENKKKCSKKSFIYLTFLGDKTGITSDIYTADDKKADIEGVINNSQKPSLDIKVKTDEIQLSDLYDKVKLLADCSKFKGLNSLTGTAQADFSLKGDLTKIKSNGFLKISNSAIKASGLDIKNINADIDFSNNLINITNAIGYVNNAPIMAKGSIDKNIDIELLMNKVDLKYLCPQTWGVKTGIVSLVANISGNLENIIHKENLKIENFSAINKNYSIGFSDFSIDTNKNNIAYINNIAFSSPDLKQLKIPSVKINVEPDALKIADTNIFMPNSKLTAKAEVLNYTNNDTTFNINLNGAINSHDVKILNDTHSIYPIKAALNGDKNTQNILIQVLLEKASILDEPAIISLASKFDNNTLKIEDLSLLSFNGNFSNDFKSNLKGQKKLSVTGAVETPLSPVFKNLRIFVPQQLNLNLYDTIAQLKGDIFINGKYTNPEIVGQISAQNLINQFLQLSVNNLTVDFNKNIAVINAPLVKLGDSSAGLSASVSTDISKSIIVKNLNIKSKYLNADTLLMYKDSPLFSYLSSVETSGGKLYCEKASATLYGTPIYLSGLSSDLSIKNNVLNLKSMTANIFNGNIAGNIDFNLKDEHFVSKIQARNVSASSMFNIISNRKDTLSGTLDVDSSINGDLASKQTLNGDLKFVIHNGHMGTLGKLEHLLYAQNVIADNMLRTSLSVVTKAITLKDTGLFKYLRGDISISNGIAHIKMLQSQGPLMALCIKGIYNPMTDYAKLTVLGRVSDEVVSGLGAFGEFSFKKLMVMLTGEEDGKYNILPDDIEKLPALNVKNTKEFMSVINGNIDKPSSVIKFNWISYTQKSLRQKEVPMGNEKVPDFIEKLPY